MPSEFCPHCRVPQHTRVSVVRHEEGQQKRRRTLETRSVHCEACGCFIRAETVEIAPPRKDKAAA